MQISPPHSTESALRTATEATTWEEGLIVGSGRVGAVLSGPADALTITFAHERYFLPLNARPDAPDLTSALGDVREALLAGNDQEASALVSAAARVDGYDKGLVWTDPLGICGTLSVRTPGGVASAHRLIDPLGGEVAVEWVDLDGGSHAVRMFAPRDEETVWISVESDRDATAVATLELGGGEETSFDTGVADGSRAVRAVATGGERGRLVSTAGTLPLTARTVVTADTGSFWLVRGSAADSSAAIEAGVPRSIRVDVAVGTEEADDAPGRAASTSDEGSWTELRERHRRTHGELTGASLLDLRAASTHEYTEDLWEAARAGDRDAERRVVEIAYLSGRANIISSTGELPATLQGVWQGTWRPAWSADYTLNGNVQNGGIASLIPTGTPELVRSFLTLLLEHTDDYRENARRIYGAEGMLLPSRMSTHGRADHFAPEYPHLFWIGCGGWALRVAADLVETTGDRSIIDDALWELAEGVLRFAETATVEIDGTRRLIPSYSPENTPGGSRLPIATDATIDVAILRDAARATALLGRARGDNTLDARWNRLVESLPAYRVADDGTLAEWIDPAWGENVAHRHVSQLYPLWYDVDPAFLGDSQQAAELRDAAAATIAAKIAWRAEEPTAPPGRMEMAFGLVQLGLAAAALGDADAAMTCARWLAVDHWRPTLTTTHDAGRIFNLDASGGLPAVVAAMLLGSTTDELSVLPALPEAWPTGSITGLRARGGLVVDTLDWDPAGVSMTVRRPAPAEWLAPDEGTLIRAPRAFELQVGGSTVAPRVRFDEQPTRIRLEWIDS
ncbi:MAG: glycosyl hydrolase family 95 catalytic domain-containing protein [Rhodoglobus sp.]